MCCEGTEIDGPEPPGSMQSAALPSALQVPGVIFRIYSEGLKREARA